MLIVARQNPSVDATTGAIQAGTPSVSAVQQSNGAVLLKYSAADPFSPGGEGLAKAIPFDVNGTIAIDPTPSGPHVGGTVTNFPALEVYNDRIGAGTATLAQSWPLFESGSTGPMAGLFWHKTIGDGTLEYGFKDQYPALTAPTLPPASHVPAVAPGMPRLVATPPGTSDLGPVTIPPTVRLHDPVIMLPALPPH